MEGNRFVRYAQCVRQYGEQNSDNHCEAIGFDVYNFAITGGVSKTLNAIATDSDHIPCVLVLNDQGGGSNECFV